MGNGGILNDGTGSPTSKKDEVIMDKNITNMSKQLNEHMYLVVRRYFSFVLIKLSYSLKHNNQKIEYILQKGDIIKLGRIKFAVKEIAIVEESMDVDEGEVRHANIECVDDNEFFEFQEVESQFTPAPGEETREDLPTCRFCWSGCTEDENPLINSC